MDLPPRESGPNVWDRVLGRVQPKISSHSFLTWFKPTRFVSEDSASIAVSVPNPWFAEWLQTHYHGVIDQALREIHRPGLEIEFCPVLAGKVSTAPQVTTPTNGSANGSPAKSVVAEGEHDARLNPRYTFDSFVVSSCNQFAHAACAAVAEKPHHTYNPLFLYGGVGLGKTHLMQAIGNVIQASGPLKIRYVSSETFVNDLINAIRFERTHEFKERYREIDVLLVDDIQFLAGKERTQEEFFHTFNALHDAQKQIVITSDVPPREIPTLEVRLRSRFEWGLIADIQPPDLETKIAILRKKSEQIGTTLPDDVTMFIASHCGSNVRELEGALNKVIAYASMSGREVSAELAREQLHDLLPLESPATTIETIQKCVADYYGLRVTDLKAKNNSPQVAQPRQLAMFLCKQLTSCSLPEIGRRFGGKHHSTVLHAIKRVNARREQEPDFDSLIESLVESLE